jgi:hypothetical protein
MWPFASIIFEKYPVGPEGWGRWEGGKVRGWEDGKVRRLEVEKVGSLECGSGNAELEKGSYEGGKVRRCADGKSGMRKWECGMRKQAHGAKSIAPGVGSLEGVRRGSLECGSRDGKL